MTLIIVGGWRLMAPSSGMVMHPSLWLFHSQCWGKGIRMRTLVSYHAHSAAGALICTQNVPRRLGETPWTGIYWWSLPWERFSHLCVQVFFCFLLSFFLFFRATGSAYGSSQARGGVGAPSCSCRPTHSPSNMGSEPRLRPTLQLMATRDP